MRREPDDDPACRGRPPAWPDGLHGYLRAGCVMPAATMHRPGTQTQPPSIARRWTDVAARIYDRAGRPKHLANANGVHASTITRFKQGAPYSPFAKAVKALVDSPKTSPFPAITEAWSVVADDYSTRSAEWLLARRSELEQNEITLNSEIQHARYTGESLRELRARQADLVLELTCIESVLDARQKGREP